MPPSQEDVCGVVNTLTSRSSRFLLYAERAQAQLARLHSELQKSQGQQNPIDIAQELTVSCIGSNKRLLEEPDHTSDSQIKRARLESGNPNPHKSPPPLNPENAPSAPMGQKHAPIAPQGTLSDAQKVSCVDTASPHATVDSPTQTPVTQPTSTDIEQRAPSQNTNTLDDASHESRGHTEAAPARRESLPASPFATETPAQEIAPLPEASEAQQSPLTTLGTQPQDFTGSRTDLSLNSPVLPGVAVAMGLPAYVRQQAPPSAPVLPFIVNVPGIWAIQVGKPSTCQIDLSFKVDQDTARCIRHWATRRQGFEYAPPPSPFDLHATAPFLSARTSDTSRFTWSLCRPLQFLLPSKLCLQVRAV
jgi:hypothetical protein